MSTAGEQSADSVAATTREKNKRHKRERSPNKGKHSKSGKRRKHKKYSRDRRRSRSRERWRSHSRERRRSRSRDKERRFEEFSDPGRSESSGDSWCFRANNPHCMAHPDSRPVAPSPLSRILEPDAPRKSYVQRGQKERSVLHWGQRKLLMSEIEFLLDFERKGNVLVYAGAAPGQHTNLLARMFPDTTFHLWDPNDFVAQNCDAVEGETGAVAVNQQLFTDEVAKSYGDKVKYPDVLFVSDIRTAAHDGTQTIQESEKRLDWDNEAQQRWHNFIQPRRSMLKFKLQYCQGKTNYLDGIIYLPVWGPQSTTETRLVPTGGSKTYDHTEYEERLFHFNTVSRVQTYPHDVRAEGLDHCFDCASEVFLLRRFLLKSRHHAEFKWSSEGDLERIDQLAPSGFGRDASSLELAASSDQSAQTKLSGQNLAAGEQKQKEPKGPTDLNRQETAESSTRGHRGQQIRREDICNRDEVCYEQLPVDLQEALDRAVAHLSEDISRKISKKNRTLKALILDKRHGLGGWGFHDQKIKALIKDGHK